MEKTRQTSSNKDHRCDGSALSTMERQTELSLTSVITMTLEKPKFRPFGPTTMASRRWDAFNCRLPDLGVFDIKMRAWTGMTCCSASPEKPRCLVILYSTSKDDEIDELDGPAQLAPTDYVKKTLFHSGFLRQTHPRSILASAWRDDRVGRAGTPEEKAVHGARASCRWTRCATRLTWKGTTVSLTVTEFLPAAGASRSAPRLSVEKPRSADVYVAYDESGLRRRPHHRQPHSNGLRKKMRQSCDDDFTAIETLYGIRLSPYNDE